MKIITKIIHWKLTLITIVILPFIVFALLTSKFEMFGIRSFIVLTGSMQPTIPQGSILFTQNNRNYSEKDIVAFKQQKENRVVTHRIVDIQNKNNVLSYQTKGDANNTVDTQLVSRTDIIGKALFHVPMAGNFVLYLRTLPGFIIFIIVPGILFIGFELWNIKKHIEIEAEKKFRKQFGSEIT